ncbi:MAG: hypothetical protein ACPGVG_12565 [Mycobacterium sp.]
MAAQPPPVRDTCVDDFVGKLALITQPNGYLYTVRKVYRTDRPLATLPDYSLKLVQRVERAVQISAGKIDWETILNVAGIMPVPSNGGDPDGIAANMMAEIIRAAGYQHTVSVTPDGAPDSATTVQGSYFVEVRGTAMNVTKAIRNKTVCQVDFSMHYTTSRLDPRRV